MLSAIDRIYEGSIDEKDFLILNDDWDIKERIQKQLSTFGLHYIPYNRKIKMLSGGETTRLFLAKAFLSNANFLLLDEPTNHLDSRARQQLYNAIQRWQGGLIIISHDRKLLKLMEEIIELTTLGANYYGGNYDEYEKQKIIEKNAKEQQLDNAKKFLQKTKRSIQSTKEKHEQRQAQGQALRRRGDQPKLLLDAMKNRSTSSQGKLITRHDRMLENAEEKLHITKEKIEINEKIQINLLATKTPNRKVLLDIEAINFAYPNLKNKIIQNFTLKICWPERIALAGDNGSGKTTLIKLIINQLQPQSGKIYIGTEHVRYLDQNATLLNPNLSILENFLKFNTDVDEKDAYRALARFLFRNVTALKLVKDLSGGERLRTLLACLIMSNHPPQLLILDEPTNHLDISSIKSIESTLKHYQGSLIVVSHDQTFLENIGIEKVITAPFTN